MRRFLALAALLLASSVRATERPLMLPRLADSCRFAVIGDSGTGGAPQLRVGQRMAE